MIAACAFCGRENESGSRFCMDCGKPINPSAARALAHPPRLGASAAEPSAARISGAPVRVPRHSPARVPPAPMSLVACPNCARKVDGALPFCGHCGSRVGRRVSIEETAPGTLSFGARRAMAGPRLALLDDEGEVATVFTLERGEAVVGRADADIRFPDDSYMSPLHARLEMRDGVLWLRDLGSRNLSWVFVDVPTRLTDGDIILVGSQMVRFRRLGFPGPYTPEADATRRMGSLTPSADVALLEQLRADGSVRDSLHLSPGRNVVLGRELGDWIFPYDLTMSGRHAEIRSEDAEFFVHDVGSRNGVALAVRGERALEAGQRILLGDQLLRVEST